MHADPPPGWKLAIVCDGKSRYFRVAAVRPGNGGYNEYDLEPAEVDARTCRYCHQEVILSKNGWRLDNNHPSGYDCEAAPRGRHGADRR